MLWLKTLLEQLEQRSCDQRVDCKLYFLCYVSKISAISKKASLRKIWSLKSYGYFYKLTNAGQTFQPIFLIYDWVN